MSTKNNVAETISFSLGKEVKEFLTEYNLSDYVNSSGKFMAPFVMFCDEETPVVIENTPESNLKLFTIKGSAGKYSVVTDSGEPLYIICESGSLAISYPYREKVTNVTCNARNNKEITITDLNGDACVSTVITLLNKK